MIKPLTLQPSASRAILLKLVALGLFALMDVLLKQLANHYGSVQVTFFRGIMALPVVMLIVQYHGGVRILKTNLGWWYVARGVLSIAMLITSIYAFARMTLADAYAIFYSAPLFVTLLSVFVLKEVVGIHRWAALLIGLGGVLFMLRPQGDGISLAMLACLFATVAYAILMVTMKLMHAHDSSIVQSFYFTLSVTVGAGALSLFSWQPLQAEDWPLLIALGVVAASAQYIMTIAYGMAPASTLAPFEYSAMLWAAGFGYLFWQEIPSPTMLFGAVIVTASGLYILYRERIHERRDDIVIPHPPEVEKP